MNLYDNFRLNWHLENGASLKIDQKTKYPWGDTVEITITPAVPAEFSVFLRAPGWSRSTEFTVNGKPAAGAAKAGHYFEIHRHWRAGDRIGVKLDMAAQLVRANPLVRDDAGRVAVQRGPVVYCIEPPTSLRPISLFDVELTAPAEAFREEFRRDLLGGVTVLRHRGVVAEKPLADEPLYRAAEVRSPVKPRADVDCLLRVGQSGVTSMEVWIPLQ